MKKECNVAKDGKHEFRQELVLKDTLVQTIIANESAKNYASCYWCGQKIQLLFKAIK